MRAEDVGRHGYEVNIAPGSHSFPSGSLVAMQRVGAVIDTSHWRTFQIIAAGDSITVAVDGEVVSRTGRAEMDEPGSLSGALMAVVLDLTGNTMTRDELTDEVRRKLGG